MEALNFLNEAVDNIFALLVLMLAVQTLAAGVITFTLIDIKGILQEILDKDAKDLDNG